jgi:hypothetical protein
MPVYKPIDRQRLIGEYIEAFRKANPDRTAPIVSYIRGQYRFKTSQEKPWEPKKYRHREMQAMLDNLRRAVGASHFH